MSSERSGEGIYYFLGNIPSHIIHALPLYRELGGTFVVLSEQAKRELDDYAVDVVAIDDQPDLGLNFGLSVKNTVNFLNTHAKVVIFYDLFRFSKFCRIRSPKKIFLTHGNWLKSYMQKNNRLQTIKQYDYMVGLGPYNKRELLEDDGVSPSTVLDLGIARTDEIYEHRGEIRFTGAIAKETGLDPDKPVIAYTPTYWGPSSVHYVGKEIVRNVPDSYNLIFRPHPQTPPVIINDYLSIISEKPGNVVYAPEGQFKTLGLTELLHASALIIGDVSSVTLEALLADKPLIFAYASDKERQSEKDYAAIREIVDYSSEVTMENVKQLEYIIKNSLARGIDKKLWNITKDRTFFHHDGTSVSSIANFIKSCL